MSTVKFTPGPWVISPSSNSSAEWDEIYSGDMGLHIASMNDCKTRNQKDTVHREDTEANARLIAAAPEMYEILETMINHPSCNKELPMPKAIIELMKKINGEQ